MMQSVVSSEDFDKLVTKHLRTVTDDNIKLTEDEMKRLTSDPKLWWMVLIQRKKAVETQLSAKSAELRERKALHRMNKGWGSLDEEEASYAGWRVKSLRFRNVVEQVIEEVKVLLERDDREFFTNLVVTERNILSKRVRELEDAILAFSAHTCGPRCSDNECQGITKLLSLVATSKEALS